MPEKLKFKFISSVSRKDIVVEVNGLQYKIIEFGTKVAPDENEENPHYNYYFELYALMPHEQRAVLIQNPGDNLINLIQEVLGQE